MKAYGIFAGGGVKGAALAGCLAAAQSRGIEFLGYGGTSAGSIVALLAAVGYSGQELEPILVKELDFQKLLDDGGAALNGAKGKFNAIQKAMRAGGMRGKLKQLKALNLTAPGLVKSLGGELGLYHGDPLIEFLRNKVVQKKPNLNGQDSITFEALHQAGCLPLKVVATDITNRCPAVFGRGMTAYGDSALLAVRASAGYPFAFRPVVVAGRLLVDGGLSSNLPAFLFDKEYGQTRVPAFAFDLLTPGSGDTTYDLIRFAQDLLETVLGASDQLLRSVLRGIHYVPVKVPAGISTLDFNLPEQKRDQLFKYGEVAAHRFFDSFPPLQRAKVAGGRLQLQLQNEYGSPQYFVPVLHALAKEIEANSHAQDVRAHIMLPTGREPPTRIVVYHYGMDRDTDSDFELDEEAGCSGQAWRTRKPAIANLEDAARDPGPWGMTPQQHGKVPSNRKSMLSVPIHRELHPGEEGSPAPVGTLSVDSTTPLEHTGWIEKMGGEAVGQGKVVGIMMRWAYIITD
jgi:NTE family protein